MVDETNLMKIFIHQTVFQSVSRPIARQSNSLHDLHDCTVLHTPLTCLLNLHVYDLLLVSKL